MRLGERIKNLRLDCGLTQEELGDRCELTKGYISQLENDLTSPSIATLVDILAALGSDLKKFFGEMEDPERYVFGKEDFCEKVGDGYTLEWLVPNAQKYDMEPVRVQLGAGAALDENYTHESEQFGYVLNGELTLIIGGKRLRCRKGQSFYIGAQKSHRIINEKNKPAAFIWISSPPDF